jgi:phage shock protein A
VNTDFLIQRRKYLLDDKSNADPEKQPDRVMMVTDTRYKKLKAELRDARGQIAKLNAENNALAMRVKQLEMAAERQRQVHKPVAPNGGRSASTFTGRRLA